MHRRGSRRERKGRDDHEGSGKRHEERKGSGKRKGPESGKRTHEGKSDGSDRASRWESVEQERGIEREGKEVREGEVE